MADYYTQTSEYSPAAFDIPTQNLTKTPTQNPTQNQTNVNVPQNVSNKNYTYDQNSFNIDFKKIILLGIKYLIEGLAIAFVAYYIGRRRIDFKEIVILGIIAAFVFAILDNFSPLIAIGARFGAGFAIAQGLFGVTPGLFGTIAGPLF